MMKRILVRFTLILNMLITASCNFGEGGLAKTPTPCVSPEKYLQIERPLMERPLINLSLSPDGQYMLGTLAREVLLWEVASGKEIHAYPIDLTRPRWPFFLPSGQLAMFREGELLVSQSGKWDEFSSVGKIKPGIISPDGRYTASSEFLSREDYLERASYWISIYEISSGQQMSRLSPFKAHYSSLAFSLDSQLFAVGTRDNKVTLWRMKDGRLIHTFEQGGRMRKDRATGEVLQWPGVPESLAFSPDGKILASANGDATVKLWDVETGKLLKTFELNGWMWYVAMSPDGRVLIAVGQEDLFVWDLEQEREICHGVERSLKPGFTALSANGKVLAIYKGLEAGIAIYDVQKLAQGKGRSSSPGK